VLETEGRCHLTYRFGRQELRGRRVESALARCPTRPSYQFFHLLRDLKLAVAKLFISADSAAASLSNLPTFGHSASKQKSACGATTRHSSSSGDEPETPGKRPENAFGRLGPRFSEESFEFRLGCCPDVEWGVSCIDGPALYVLMWWPGGC